MSSGVALTGTRMESLALLGSLPGPVQEIIRPLVEPLLARWDALVGDDDAVHESAARWRGLADHLHELGRQQVRTVEDSDAAWLGLAQRSFADAAADVAVELEELARRATDVGACLDEAAVAVRTTEQLVRDPVRELLEWAALSLTVSAATALVTLGASAIAGASRGGCEGSRDCVPDHGARAPAGRCAARAHRASERYRDWVKDQSRAKQWVLDRLEKKAKSKAAQQGTGPDGDYKTPARGLLGSATGDLRTPVP
ncbi:WXG100 family type VII secretion target [Nocardioides sp. B-3]|uniref:WXG100 family type VII secretion target n=1 Tax=Nocardioides sp. B-3 TaxID=2895565 RepID=UPI0021521A4C|nr:hypothetical protein [Nocardioides sp. B-3]UUZ61168.1 hypothetical protein LP418_11405 [Nocardioides sp. B-3]